MVQRLCKLACQQKVRFVVFLFLLSFLCSGSLAHVFVLFCPNSVADLLLWKHHGAVLINLLPRWRFFMVESHLVRSLKSCNWLFFCSCPSETRKWVAFVLIYILNQRCWTEASWRVFVIFLHPVFLRFVLGSRRVKIRFENCSVMYLLHLDVSRVDDILAPVILLE